MAASQDEYHLRVLEVFHYVVAGLEALFACIPLIHVGIGLLMVFNPEAMTDNGGKAPPAFLGWVFAGIGGAVIVLGWTMAALVAYAGRCLRARRRHLFILVIAALNCGFMPFGTVLGVFTLVVLLRPEVRALFEGASSPSA